MKKIIFLLFCMAIFNQNDFAMAYQSYADSPTAPGVTCSNCHGDGRVWFAPVSVDPVVSGIPTAPTLQISTTGVNLFLSWSVVEGAENYTLYYAEIPYTGSQSINNIDMGSQTQFSATLPNGSAYYVAIKARNEAGESEFSNIESFALHDDEDNASQELQSTCLDCHIDLRSEVACNNSKWAAHNGNQVSNVIYAAINSYLTGSSCDTNGEGTSEVSNTIDPAQELLTTCLTCHGDESEEIQCGDKEWLKHSGQRVSEAIFQAVNELVNGPSCTAANDNNREEENDDDEEDEEEEDDDDDDDD